MPVTAAPSPQQQQQQQQQQHQQQQQEANMASSLPSPLSWSSVVLPSKEDRLIAFQTIYAVATAVVVSASPSPSPSSSSSSMSKWQTGVADDDGDDDDDSNNVNDNENDDKAAWNPPVRKRRHSKALSPLSEEKVVTVTQPLPIRKDDVNFNIDVDAADVETTNTTTKSTTKKLTMTKTTAPSSSSSSSSSSSKEVKIRRSEERRYARLRSVLLDELIRSAAYCLMLPERVACSDEDGDDGECGAASLGIHGHVWPQRRPDDAFGCVALLLSNHHMARCGGGGVGAAAAPVPPAPAPAPGAGAGLGRAEEASNRPGRRTIDAAGKTSRYDARVRNVLRIASSFLLAESEYRAKSTMREQATAAPTASNTITTTTQTRSDGGGAAAAATGADTAAGSAAADTVTTSVSATPAPKKDLREEMCKSWSYRRGSREGHRTRSIRQLNDTTLTMTLGNQSEKTNGNDCSTEAGTDSTTTTKTTRTRTMTTKTTFPGHVDFSASASTLDDFLTESFEQLAVVDCNSSSFSNDDDNDNKNNKRGGDMASHRKEKNIGDDDGNDDNGNDDNNNDEAIIDKVDAFKTTRSDPGLRMRDAARKFDAIEKVVASHLCDVLLVAASNSPSSSTSSSLAQKEISSSARTTTTTKPIGAIPSKGGNNGGIILGKGGGGGGGNSTYYCYYSREDVMRGLKIGSVGVVAGALFAITGGLAAPGIAAGMAALGGVGATAATALAATQASVAVAALFGVGGGGLAAYKMKRRTDGLKEFRVRKEEAPSRSSSKAEVDTTKASKRTGTTGESSSSSKQPTTAAATTATASAANAELRTTVCVSGWLTDKHDFQRPWGITPTDPPLTDRMELLQRFYSIHNVEKVSRCAYILSAYEEKEDELWIDLKRKYGRDPNHLLPLDGYGNDDNDVGAAMALTDDEKRRVSDVFGAILFRDVAPDRTTDAARLGRKDGIGESYAPSLAGDDGTSRSGGTRSDKSGKTTSRTTERRDVSSNGEGTIVVTSRNKTRGDGPNDASISAAAATAAAAATTVAAVKVPDKVKAWDFRSRYGGDMYTITWESDRLLSLCDYITALAARLASDASKEVLKWTALATLMSAVAWPSAVKAVADLIDEPWTMITLRSDEAGIELARCLLQSEEERPVTLIGYSFGGRVVLSCLKELAKRQEIWEQRRQCRGPNDAVVNDGGNDNEDDDVRCTREPASIVEGAVIMGAPSYIDRSTWASCRRVVAGRLVNCYSQKDWILKLMYQYQTATGVFRPTCGTAPVSGVRGVENYDVSSLVTTQEKYCESVGNVLEFIGHGEPHIAMD